MNLGDSIADLNLVGNRLDFFILFELFVFVGYREQTYVCVRMDVETDVGEQNQLNHKAANGANGQTNEDENPDAQVELEGLAGVQDEEHVEGNGEPHDRRIGKKCTAHGVFGPENEPSNN